MRALFIAAAALALAPGAAHAAYFVTAVAQLGSQSDGGYVANGPTSASASVAGGASRAQVDIATGKARTYLGFYGPDAASGDFGSNGAVFGDTVTFSGISNATFKFNVDGTIYSDPLDPANTSTYQVLVVANLRVFQAGSGATANNFTSHAGALVSDSYLLNLVNPTAGLSMSIDEDLFGATSVVSGGSYDVFASFSAAVAMNGHDAYAELDFLHTASFGIEVDPGVSYASESGVLLTSAAVPEPSAWATMILGFCGAGAMLRGARRRVAA